MSPGRLIVMWADDGMTTEAIEAQARAERGMKDGDELVVVRWMSRSPLGEA